jgi:hypothetical protein
MALRLSGLQKPNTLQTLGRIRHLPPSGNAVMPDGASLIRPTKQNPLQTVGRIRHLPPSGNGAMPDGAALIRPTKAKSSASRRPVKAFAAIRQCRYA